MFDIVFDGGPSIKWVGQTWRRRESGRGREASRSQDTNAGNPLRVDSSSAGVSMPMPLPPRCRAPARAFPPPPHTFVTANLIPVMSRSKHEFYGEGRRRGSRPQGEGGFRQSVEHLTCVPDDLLALGIKQWSERGKKSAAVVAAVGGRRWWVCFTVGEGGSGEFSRRQPAAGAGEQQPGTDRRWREG